MAVVTVVVLAEAAQATFYRNHESNKRITAIWMIVTGRTCLGWWSFRILNVVPFAGASEWSATCVVRVAAAAP